MLLLVAANIYLCANALLILAALLFLTLELIGSALQRPISYRYRLRTAQVLIVGAVSLPFIGTFSSHGAMLPHTAQIWSAPAMQADVVGVSEVPRLTASFIPAASIPLHLAGQVAVALFLIGVLIVAVRIVLDALVTIRTLAAAQGIRRLGGLRILASEDIQVPFSFWLPKRCCIVVPSNLLLRPADLKLVIRHEVQHHRQLDTRWLYFHLLLKAIFFWNPAIHSLGRRLRELQEFACDEALRGQRSICIETYCRCLLSIAEAVSRKRTRLLQTGFIGSSGSSQLKRRIEALLARPSGGTYGAAVLFTGGITLTLMAGAAFAFASPIHDRRVSAESAREMALSARQESDFPIVVNDRVLSQLNRMLATPDGREHLRAALARMHEHEPLISRQLAQHGLPPELLAVPLVESGYRNLPAVGDPRRGAGLWMFIAPTARHFGLAVDGRRDERLDVAAETGAAMRYFSILHRQFDDWGLALLGYNAGSTRVERGIRETASRDVWRLIGSGHENDPDYVPRVMAVILIIKNPGLLG